MAPGEVQASCPLSTMANVLSVCACNRRGLGYCPCSEVAVVRVVIWQTNGEEEEAASECGEVEGEGASGPSAAA